MTREIGEIDKQLTARLGCVTLLIIGIVAIVYPIFAPAPSHHHRQSCLTNLKQVMTSSLMYAADVDDNMPLYYTFDFPSNWDSLSEADKALQNPAKKYRDVIWPYLKNDQMLLCPEDEQVLASADLPRREGTPRVMTYVHTLSLRGAIPDFSNGKREINNGPKGVENPAAVAYLREPIRGYGLNDEGKPAFLSPHKSIFPIAYLDGHAKATKSLDPRTQL